jgi:hypothetical protein
MRRLFIVLAALTGCGQPAGGTGPGLDRIPFRPPDSYLAMWETAQACSRVRMHIGFVSWEVVPGVWTFATADSVGAVAYTDQSVITIAGGWLDHPLVVRHEMLHALLGTREHPSEPFDFPCRATENSWDEDEAFLALPSDLARYHPDSYQF